MKKKLLFWLRCVLVAIVCGVIVAAFVYILCRVWTADAIFEDAGTAHTAEMVRRTLAGIVGGTVTLWAITIQLGIRHRINERRTRERELERQKAMVADARAVTLNDIVDSRRNYDGITIYGERVTIYDNAEPLYLLFKVLAVFALFVLFSTGSILLLMLYSIL